MHANPTFSPLARTLLVGFFLVGAIAAVLGSVNSMQAIAAAGLTASGTAVGWCLGKKLRHSDSAES